MLPPLPAFLQGLPVAITVCDAKGIIIAMNDRSATVFAADGGRNLIGRSLLDCHNEHSRQIIRELLDVHKSNTYTIEKNGIRKLIHQTPWFDGDAFGGLVELSIEIPDQMPHFVRG